MEAGLYIVATPIGNLEDITARALRILGAADRIYAEDTRRTRRLLSHYSLHTPLSSCPQQREDERAGHIIDQVAAGEAIALVTDAGTPGISDPGARIVRRVRAAGLPVHLAPGPSAVTAAVALSGLGGGGYHFAGFLPRKSGRRRRVLEELAALPVPVVLFESPPRLLRLLEELEQVIGERTVFIGRELTKMHEETLAGTPAALREQFGAGRIRGELVLVLASARDKG